jgi:5-methylcytosine-specific restriction endonuclease McrA
MMRTWVVRAGESVVASGSFIEREKPINKVGAAKKRNQSRERKFKDGVRRRDGFCCQKCGKEAGHVHHLLTVGAHKELEFTAANCLTLCPWCHTEGPNAAHKDPQAFNRWAADEFPRFMPLYAQYGRGEA